ncbi:MAG: EAL domain-containing protein [Pseudomonadota bacterium]
MGEFSSVVKPQRRLSRVLLQTTLFLAVSLGLVSGALQVWTDLRQEKDAVQYSAQEFLQSVAPSAASAAYNFYDEAAERVVEGLFTQRAIAAVTIINEGDEMVSRSRAVERTLPAFGAITSADEVILTEDLISPADAAGETIIGSISITVDRSIVPPAIVNRMFMYFVLATFKNTMLGLLLVAVVYGALARHIVSLATVTGKWTPDRGELKVSAPPQLLAGTELEILGRRIEQLSGSALGKIKEIEELRQIALQNNSELAEKSEHLSQALEIQNIELQRSNARLKEIAEKDSLTGILNRRSFEQQSQEISERAARDGSVLSVLLLDVDHFKAYNDYYGHQTGDECLQTIAAALQSCADDHNALLARYGGEEFIILAASCDEAAAKVLGNKLHDRIHDAQIEHQRSSVSSCITISIGSASNSDLPDRQKWDLNRLISAADEALYEAKRNGRNCTEYATLELQERTRTERSARRQLLEAVEKEEFVPFFQPQYNSVTGEIAGIEVLARWRQPDGSLKGPYAFLDDAVECGFITKIDTIILKRVRDFAAEASDRGISLPRLSINVPRENLSSQTYVQNLVDFSTKCGTTVAVELLETAILDHADDVIAFQLDLLRDSDVEIEIDDFGTGHTSLVSLMALRPSRLKIAKELVLPMMESREHRKLTLSVIEIGRALDIEVLAEGVETRELAEDLTANGCPLHQGFHYARPMSGEDMLGRLSRAVSRQVA